MSDLKSVNRYQLQQAFAVAHRSASNMNLDPKSRKAFRLVARLIWESCGDDGPYKQRLDPDVESVLNMLCVEALEATHASH